MNKQQFMYLVIILALSVSAGTAHAETPDEFRQRHLREVEEFRHSRESEMAKFCDSVNREYAWFIEQQWERMKTLRTNRSFTPPPLSFVPHPSDTIPTPETYLAPEPQTPPLIIEPSQIAYVPTGHEISFYGKTVKLYKESLHLPHLRSITGKDVATYWRSLSGNMSGIIDELCGIENEIGLDDWGVFQLSYKLAPRNINDITPNERVIFTVYVLCQRGFKCKLAESGGKLYPMLATADKLFNTWHIDISRDSVRYYVVTTDQLDYVNVCTADFPSASHKLDITPHNLPPIGGTRYNLIRSWHDYSGTNYDCNINYDPEVVRYLDSYPCIDFKK